ncbi:hypothetical protein LMG29542_04251 [Paraburkholderia humisilvae]|uniref:Uncharacterized protein n=2 Tax=Paraburkholderia humisilvae TaxID=627669 RepID=A0A6J5E6L4_9BURK|nr:hypothetical protein LMG29542_04251 [Paraburkholderia humisilvae]
MKKVNLTHRPFFGYALKPAAIFILLFAAMAASAQTCVPPPHDNWVAWLDNQEEAGGHAQACHLNVSESGLIGRLENRGGGSEDTKCQPNGRAASSWSDKQALIRSIKPSIIDESPRFAIGPAGTLELHGTAERTIGTVVTRFEGRDLGKNVDHCDNRKYVCASTKKWTAILRKTADGRCFLVTAYPAD